MNNQVRAFVSRRRYDVLALSVALVMVAVHFYADTQPVTAGQTGALAAGINFLQGRATDLKFRLRGQARAHPDVVVAVVDEKSVQKYGLWPWSRALTAKALLNLHQAGATAIGLDIVFIDEVRRDTRLDSAAQRFDQAVQGDPKVATQLAAYRRYLDTLKAEDPDQALEEVFAAASPKLVFGLFGYGPEARDQFKAREADYVRLLQPHATWTFPAENGVSVYQPEFDGARFGAPVFAAQMPLERFARHARHAGILDVNQDPDGTIRRMPPFSQAAAVRGLVPSMALQLAALQLGAAIEPLYTITDKKVVGVRLRREGRPSVQVPMLLNEPYTLIDHVGMPESFNNLSLSDVVDGAFDPAAVKGKAVIVGVSLIGFGVDQRVMPFSQKYPGTYLHASMVSNILSGKFLHRPVELRNVEQLLMLVFALVLARALPRARFHWKLALVFGLMGAYFGVDLLLFSGPKLLMATVMPLASVFLTSFGVIFLGYLSTDREKGMLRHAFQHYLNPSVMEQMLAHPDRLKLGGEKREMTVLFSDIRGFTTLSERMAPEALVRFINSYLTPMTRIVFEEGGTLDKYIGDALMAFWSAPLEQPDHAVRACRAAVRFIDTLQELKAAWRDQNLPEFDIGVGINTGPMIVGNMGSDIRFDYTVMGDSVNLASRLEGTNKEYETRILMSESTFLQAKDQVTARRLGAVRVKGKRKPVRIYELRGMGQPAAAEAEAIRAFEAAVDHFSERRWDEAEAGFRKVMESWTDDAPSRRYLEEIKEYRVQPPPPQWDGVYTPTTK
ncbi:MAG TPA: adenylate/guanylate cyclase domain-containing protein [Myxococcales bacterium]|nr:adenylate/guanylate cyclase domain-containing protein [Myxococcales bacterium]